MKIMNIEAQMNFSDWQYFGYIFTQGCQQTNAVLIPQEMTLSSIMFSTFLDFILYAFSFDFCLNLFPVINHNYEHNSYQ